VIKNTVSVSECKEIKVQRRLGYQEQIKWAIQNRRENMKMKIHKRKNKRQDLKYHGMDGGTNWPNSQWLIICLFG
jgi:hypothetical protein